MVQIIRPAKIGDGSGIAEIHVAGWKISYQGLFPQEILDNITLEDKTKIWTQNLLEPKRRLAMFVAEEDGVITGFISLHDFREETNISKHGEVTALYIHPDQQRKGIGEKLFKQAKEWFQKNDYSVLSIKTLTASPFRKFYENQGGIAQDKPSIWKADNGYEAELVEFRWALK